jgi:predicted permease
MNQWRARLRALFHRDRLDRVDDEMREELEAHLQMEIEANVDRGMTAEEARNVATQQFGNRTAIREASRDEWTFAGLETLVQDLRYGVRLLRRAPGFAITAIAIVALGVGATTAAFTVLDHVLLRPLPFPNPDRLVLLYQNAPARSIVRMEATPPNFEDWRTMNRSFSAIGAYIPAEIPVNLSGKGEPLRLDGYMTSAAVFATLDVQAAVGRVFSGDDERTDAAGVVLFSDGLATTLFGGPQQAVGQVVNLDGRPSTVIGVMPKGFAFPYRGTDMWMPLRGIPAAAWNNRGNSILNVIARLRPDVSLDGARADMAVVAAQLERAYPKENAGVRVDVLRLRDALTPASRTLVLAVFGAAFCLLLIACTNLANLVFARTASRAHEMAVRMAIGAGRRRIVRQLLTESVLLAAAGGLAGLLLALLVTPSLGLLVPSSLPIGALPGIDWRVFTFAAVLTMVTSITFGLSPAWRSSKMADVTVLRTRVGAGALGARFRAALVLVEVAGTVALLVSAGLLLKAMWRVQSVDPGFRTEGVLTLRTALPLPLSQTARRDFYTRVLAQARSLPGVTSAGYISFLPMTFPAGNLVVTVPGLTLTAEVRAHTRFITSDYLGTMRIPLLRGRDVSENDDAKATPVTVISASLARRLWQEEDPIGRQMTLAGVNWTVVGVTGDVIVRGLERANLPQAYFPYDQLPAIGAYYAPKDLAVRTTGDPMALVPSLRAIIKDVRPDQALSDIRPLEEIVASQTAPRREQLRVLGVFAAMAFLLAAVGIHGLLSFTVSSRAQEIGVRLALGAARGQVLGMFVRQGVWLGMAGIAVALPLAYLAARSMSALLFGVTPVDPVIYGAAILITMVMTVAGSLQPALRAAGIDPAVTMKNE